MSFFYLTFLSLVSVNVWSSQSCTNKNCLLEKNTAGDKRERVNIDGSALKICSTDPMTGYTRSGYCDYSPSDRGQHFVCAEVSAEFLIIHKKWEMILVLLIQDTVLKD